MNSLVDYSSEEEKITDDYFVLEGDISSTGGYITLISLSVPVDKIEPDVIQRRSSDCAPVSPRDQADILKEQVERMQRKQDDLAAELKEKESELEDLGCWRALLSKVCH